MFTIVTMGEDKNISSEKEITTIQLSRKLRDKLNSLGKKGDTYEGIIWRLIGKR